MSEVYDEFKLQLAEWREKYKDRPRREMVRLFLLALEREQIVSVAYREDLIARRLESLPLPEEVRGVIRSALLWAWKDEEIHAIYIRGALMKLGSPLLRVVSIIQQVVGGVAGWASSVTTHLRFRDAPISRSLASMITFAGWILGKVPSAVRKQMRYHSFREFCQFNVGAERTASLCWQRLVELAQQHRDVASISVEDFARMEQDEDRHAQIFGIFAGALDESDRLLPGETAETLARKIAAVGEAFLDRTRRRTLEAGNPLGSGGRVVSREGRLEDDKIALFRRLLDEAGLPEKLRARAAERRAQGADAGELRAVIKATFMLGYHRKDLSPLVDPALLRELARYLREHGFTSVAVVESPNLYDWFFQHRSVREVASYFGLTSGDFEIIDMSEEQVAHAYQRGMAQYSVSRAWKEADFRVSFGKLRSHPIEIAHLSMANLEGLGTRCDAFLFPERQAHRDAAVMTLAGDFPPHFAVLEGYDAAGDGLMGVMGCPRARSPRRLYAGEDALAVDIVAARHLGLEDPRESNLLETAIQWFGDPRERTEVVGDDVPVRGWRGPHHSEWSALLSFLANPVFVFASGRGALFVPEMDEEAFPPVKRPGALLRMGRSAGRALTGLRHPRQ